MTYVDLFEITMFCHVNVIICIIRRGYMWILLLRNVGTNFMDLQYMFNIGFDVGIKYGICDCISCHHNGNAYIMVVCDLCIYKSFIMLHSKDLVQSCVSRIC